jgi:DNA-directed RNA polymerase subunit M/transcription elongation factor TFIIS
LINSKRYPYGPEYDSSLGGPVSIDSDVQPPMPAELARWKIEVLRLWSDNIGRNASQSDIVFFRGILEVKEDVISARLQAFTNEKRRLGDLGGGTRIGAEALSLWIQNPFPRINQANEYSAIEGRAISIFENMQPKNHALALPPFPSAYDGLFNQVVVHDQTCSDDQPHAKDVLLLDGNNDPTPGLRMSRDHGKQRQLEHIVPGSLTSSHAPVWPSSMGGVDIPAIPWRRIRDLANHLIYKKRGEGCGSIRAHESQEGRFPCSLGCGRRFKSSADAFRHEEIVYPQNFWFCLACGDPNKPAEEHLFTRKDKLRKHVRGLNHSIDINHCKVPNVRTLYPERCGFCSNHRHPNWKERCKHLIRHCKKGDFATNARSRGTGKIQDSTNSNDGGDDDDDDESDGDSDEDPQDEPEERNEDGNGGASNGEGPSDTDRKRDADDYDPGQFGTTADDDEDELFGSFLMDSPSLYHYRSSALIMALRSEDNRKQNHVKSSSSTSTTLLEELIRSDTSLLQSHDQYEPLPEGRWTIAFQGNCPKCHHYNKALQVRVTSDFSQVSYVHCERCQDKWVAFGGRNSTRTSLLSTTMTEADIVERGARYSLVDIVKLAQQKAAGITQDFDSNGTDLDLTNENAPGRQEARTTSLHTLYDVVQRSFGCLASGSDYIHNQASWHKDIEPQNIVVHTSQMIYADFGHNLYDADGKHNCDSTQHMDFEALMNIWGTRDIPRNAILILVVLEPCPDTERQATYSLYSVKHGRIHKHSERKCPLKLGTTGQRSRSVRTFRIWNCMLFSSESGTDLEGAASSRC